MAEAAIVGAVFTGAGPTLTLHFVRDPDEVRPAEPPGPDGTFSAVTPDSALGRG